MAGENSAAYSGPLSPEEVAECDREMEEMARQNKERMARRIDERIKRSIEHSIERGIVRSYDDGMSEAIDRRRRFEARERIRRARAEIEAAPDAGGAPSRDPPPRATPAAGRPAAGA